MHLGVRHALPTTRGPCGPRYPDFCNVGRPHVSFLTRHPKLSGLTLAVCKIDTVIRNLRVDIVMLDSEVPITLEGLAEMFHVSHAETESDAFMELQLAMQKPLNQNSHAIDFPFKAAIGALVVATLHQEPWPSDRLIGMLLKNITKSLAANGEALSQASNVEKPELTSMAVLLCLFCHTISSIQVMQRLRSLGEQHKAVEPF